MQAYPYAKAVDVVEEVIKKVKPIDLVQVLPMSAYLWKDVEKIMLPPQTKVLAHDPVDLRLSRWELYQRVRQVPVMSYGVVQKTLILPWHITMDHAKMRIDDRAPPHKEWLLTAASPQDWVLHQIPLSKHMREELHELDFLREQARQRGGMITGKVPLRVYLVHMEEMQQWKLDTDMDIEYLIKAFAEECETELTNVLIMREKHIPGLHEIITSYLPEVQVYIPDCIDEDTVMSLHTMRSAAMWQRAKQGRFPWGIPLLPRPTGKPVSYHPLQGAVTLNMYKCMLRPAHAPQEIYVVDICEKATIGDMLTILEKTTPYLKSSMMVVKEGRILPTHANAMTALPVSFLLEGSLLDAADICVPEDFSSEISWLTPTLASPSQSSRGGARTARVSQHPRSAMIVWAEDKISREVPGLNMLTVRMLLRAEQRTVSAVLHARSEAQTKEVIRAAFRRAGLTMGAGAHEENDIVSLDTTTALRQQTVISTDR